MAVTDLERNAFMENLEECIQDKNEIVTFDWFSECFGIHVNESKNLLEEYASRNRSGFHTRCIGGTDKDGGLRIYVTTDGRVSDIASQLKRKLFEHIYSAQKSRLDDSNLLFTVDHGKFSENPDASGQFSAVRANSEMPKTNGTKAETKPVSNGSAVATASKAAVAQAFTKIVKPAVVEEKVEVKKEPVKETKPAAPKPAPNTSKISSMFARQQSRPPADKPKKAIEDKEPEKPVIDVQAETKIPEVTKREESKTKNKRTLDEKDDSKKKKQKPQQKKMRRIQQISDSSESESSDDFERAPSPAEPEGPPAAELLESDEEPEPEPQQVVQTATGTRKRTMKLVTKQFMDEDGFLITKKEYEACSESDEEEKTPAASADKKESIAGQTTAAAATSSKEPAKRPSSPPVKKKQSTISSFFTRK